MKKIICCSLLAFGFMFSSADVYRYSLDGQQSTLSEQTKEKKNKKDKKKKDKKKNKGIANQIIEAEAKAEFAEKSANNQPTPLYVKN